MRRCALLLFFCAGIFACKAQTLGGSSAFNFLKQPASPQLTALGGINISNQNEDPGLSFLAPSLLRKSMHTQASFVFNSMYGGIGNYHLKGVYHHKPWKTNFALGVHYFNYGSVDQTDAAGNIFGDFRPVDYVVSLSMSREYLQRWHYGASLKMMSSNYGPWRSSGIGLDLSVSYQDTSSGIQASLAVLNMGSQLKSFTGAQTEELPFDIQLGVSKRLAHAPLQFSVTANRLHRFDVTYMDTLFNNENGFASGNKTFSFDNIFRHFVFATQVYVGDHVELTIGYNYLRRKELNIGSTGNGLNGFSAGIGILFRKIKLRYGRAYYQSNRSYHQFGLNLPLKEYFANFTGNRK